MGRSPVSVAILRQRDHSARCRTDLARFACVSAIFGTFLRRLVGGSLPCEDGGARNRNRTGTTFRSRDFKSLVSTYFTIRAI